MSSQNVNSACNAHYLDHDSWVILACKNFGPAVQQVDFLGLLPLADDSAELMHFPRFLSHIPLNKLSAFLSQYVRILKTCGVSQLVVPDLKNLCLTCLSHPNSGEHDQADFLVLELLDQCVRRESDREQGLYHKQLQLAPEQNVEAMAVVRDHTGYGRASSLSLRRLSAPAVIGRRRLCGHRTPQCCHQLRGRLPLPSPRPCGRWPTPQRGQVIVYREPEAWLSRWGQTIADVLQEGG